MQRQPLARYLSAQVRVEALVASLEVLALLALATLHALDRALKLLLVLLVQLLAVLKPSDCIRKLPVLLLQALVLLRTHPHGEAQILLLLLARDLD